MKNEHENTSNVISLADARTRLRPERAMSVGAVLAGGVDKKQDLIRLLEEAALHKAQARKAGSIAAGLYEAARIREGSELVAVLGDGTERTNRMAVFTWVCNHQFLIEEAEQANVRPVFYLLPYLKKELDAANDWL